MHNNWCVDKRLVIVIHLMLGFALNAIAQDINRNYISTKTFLSADTSRQSYAVQYFDGIGRPVLSASNAMSPLSKYSYTKTEYDLYGRDSVKWLSAISSISKPEYMDDISQISSSTYDGDTRAYQVTYYDGLDRPTRTIPPGKQWHDNSKYRRTKYLLNGTANPVKLYTTNSLNSNVIEEKGKYLENMLKGVESIDEDGHVTIVFKDRRGNVILERKNNENDTYYVYSANNLLRFVLTPQYQTSNDVYLDAYEYRYDQLNRLIFKRFPGCEPTTYSYDNADRIITEQTPLLRDKGRMRFYLYDALGRLCVQGTCQQETVNVSYATTSYSAGNSGLLNTGYSTPYNYKSAKLELAYYYDGYSFFASPNYREFNKVNELHTSTFPEAEQYARGSKTGEAVMTSDGKLLLSSYYYNQKGNLISEGHTNYDGTVRKVFTEYSFTDKPTKVTKVYFYGNIPYTITTVYTYNRYNDKLEKTLVRCGDNGMQHVVSHLSYDDLGQVVSDMRTDINDKIEYTYDLHGWTTDIKGKYFTEKLNYTTGSNNPCYNGNISSLLWKASDSVIRGYRFHYNERNMLRNATYGEGPGTTINVGLYDEHVNYTDNNAISRLTRGGMYIPGTYMMFDDLYMTYSGSRLNNIRDAYTRKLSYSGAFEYVDNHNGTAASPDFTYNTSGMMTSDLDKGISKITYNDIGLTDSICFANGTCINYFYSMKGEKLRVQKSFTLLPIYTGGTTTNNTHEFYDNIYYGSDAVVNRYSQIATFFFGDGYIDIPIPSSSTWPVTQYYYYAKDHLGNIRSVVTKNSQGVISEVQKTHYYPFGGIIADISTGRSVQDRLYNGKELDTACNLWWYDFGARQYDPAAPRFITPDPLAEKYYGWNMYGYCMNNPVRFVDFDGMDVYIYGTKKEQMEVLARMQSLTNDRLQINYKTGLVSITAVGTRNTGKDLYVGTSLIYGLVHDNNKMNISVVRGEFKVHDVYRQDAINGKGTDVSVEVDFSSKHSFLTQNANTGTIRKEQMNKAIALGHELIHGYRSMNGEALSDLSKEENITVGIEGNYKFTENKLRQEQGLNKRLKY